MRVCVPAKTKCRIKESIINFICLSRALKPLNKRIQVGTDKQFYIPIWGLGTTQQTYHIRTDKHFYLPVWGQ